MNYPPSDGVKGESMLPEPLMAQAQAAIDHALAQPTPWTGEAIRLFPQSPSWVARLEHTLVRSDFMFNIEFEHNGEVYILHHAPSTKQDESPA